VTNVMSDVFVLNTANIRRKHHVGPLMKAFQAMLVALHWHDMFPDFSTSANNVADSQGSHGLSSAKSADDNHKPNKFTVNKASINNINSSIVNNDHSDNNNSNNNATTPTNMVSGNSSKTGSEVVSGNKSYPELPPGLIPSMRLRIDTSVNKPTLSKLPVIYHGAVAQNNKVAPDGPALNPTLPTTTTTLVQSLRQTVSSIRKSLSLQATAAPMQAETDVEWSGRLMNDTESRHFFKLLSSHSVVGRGDVEDDKVEIVDLVTELPAQFSRRIVPFCLNMESVSSSLLDRSSQEVELQDSAKQTALTRDVELV
jgi:hypothetical protein